MKTTIMLWILSILVIALSVCLAAASKKRDDCAKLARDYKYNFELMRNRVSEINFITAYKYDFIPLMIRKKIPLTNVCETTDEEIIKATVDEFMEHYKDALRDYVIIHSEEDIPNGTLDIQASLMVGKLKEEN